MIAIVLIAVLVVVVAAVVVAFVPVQQVSFSQSNEASAARVDSLRLTVNADVANVNVVLRDLPGNQRATVDVSATGWRGIFGNDKPLALSFNESTQGETLVYSVAVSRAGGWPVFNPLNVNCDIAVDPSVNLSITVATNTGAIVVDTDREATFQRLVLESTTGSVTANLREGTLIAGDFSLQTTTGSTQLLWEEAQVSGNSSFSVRTTTGSVDVNVTQTRQLGGNVTLDAEATTGGVNLTMKIQNDVAAHISANTGLGGVNVNQQGFSGNQVPTQSSNYPANANFDVTLKTSLGGININATYELGGTRT